MKKIINSHLLFFIIYLETIIHLKIFTTIDINYLNIILFSTIYFLIIKIITSLFKPKVNKILNFIIYFILALFFASQLIYNDVYNSFISLYSFTNGSQILQFASEISSTIFNNLVYIILFFIPVILLIIFHKKIDFSQKTIKYNLYLSAVAIIIYIIALLFINNYNKDDLYSNKNLYFNTHNVLKTTKNFGILTYFKLDISRNIIEFEENLTIEIPTEIPKIEEPLEYNMLEIDFETLINNETDEVIKDMYTYFSTINPTLKNKYTGMFEGKNLIVIVAEAFSDIAIDKNITPTLYKLYSEGFTFTNYYNPLFPVSTADGEYIADTSLLPKEGVWSLSRVSNNYMPYSYPNVFEVLGYNSYAYHNHTYSYYDRDEYIYNMGYDLYKACGNGLEINCNIWPESDIEMMEVSIPDYITDEKFITYYMTVSGHLEYNNYGNYIAYKNYDSVKDLDLSLEAKSYLATQIELDKAVQLLIEELEKQGILEDTVITIVPDHYPYGLELEEINEISTYEKDSKFDIHKSAWLLWNSEMENIQVDTLTSSLDVIPTLYNLFNIEYDSRLFMGQDVLSKTEQLVIFSDRSFITDEGRYNAVTEKFSVDINQEYIDEINIEIYNKFKYSTLILEQDFYQQLYNDIN